jgi:hypothetical protein
MEQRKKEAADATAAFLKIQSLVENSRKDYEEAQEDADKSSPPPPPPPFPT